MEIERTKAYLEEILPGMGYVLDSVTYTKEAGTHYLRAFIFRKDEQDMTVNDCAMVSRRLSKWLDKEDFIAEEYILEVVPWALRIIRGRRSFPRWKKNCFPRERKLLKSKL